MSGNTPDQIQFSERLSKDEIELGSAFAPKFGDDGTIPAIATDAKTGDVLMFAFMNRESLSLSIQTGIVHYWSRSRNQLWKKGETSGNLQHIVEMRTDCDQDVILVRVSVEGDGASCHQGYRTCFYRTIKEVGNNTSDPELVLNEDKRLFDPDKVYK